MLNNKYDFLLHVQCQIDCKPSVSFASKLYIQVRRTYKYMCLHMSNAYAAAPRHTTLYCHQPT